MQQKNYQPQSFSKEQILRFLGLIPFVVMHNLSAVFFRVRGVPQEDLGLSAIGYFAGLASSALMLPVLERNMAKDGATGRAWRVGGLLGMLFPAFFSLTLPFVVPGSSVGNPVLNTFQPFLWALFLPIAFRLFFHPALSGFHGILFGMVAAVGHLCWALLLPILSMSEPNAQVMPGTVAFLNVARCTFSIGFAIIAWLLMTRAAAATVELRHSGRPPEAYARKPPLVSATKLWSFLLPLSACFFLSGVLGHMVFGPLYANKEHAEYMHLFLAALLLFLGFWVTSKGDKILKTFITVALVCFASSPLFLYFPPGSSLFRMIYFSYSVSYQVLLFAGTLVCGLLALYSNRPALIAPAVLFANSASLTGELFARYVTSSLPISSFLFVCIWGTLCIGSIPLVRRIFPLPAPVAGQIPRGDTATSNPEDSTTRMRDFAKSYRLNGRETQILEMLLRGLSTGEMAEFMNLKENTVRTYAQSLLKKTGTNSRLGLVAIFSASKEEG